MGNINIVISDEVEALFKKEVFNRFGMKKGNISSAVEEALKLWSESTIDNLKQVALQGSGYSDREEAIKVLGKMKNDSSLSALSYIARYSGNSSDRTLAIKLINGILNATSDDAPFHAESGPSI